MGADHELSNFEFREKFVETVGSHHPEGPYPEINQRGKRLLNALYYFVVPQLQALAESRGRREGPVVESASDYRARICWQAEDIIDRLAMALPAFPKEPGLLWTHRPHPFGDKYGPSVNKDELENVAADYLTRDWYGNYIDWCIVDALVCVECDAFVGHLHVSVSFIRVQLAVFAAIAAADFWLLGFTVSNVISVTGLWGLGAIGLISWLIFDGRAVTRFANRHLLSAMNRAYQELNGHILNPTRVLEQLNVAERAGVVWPTAIWPVLNAVIAGNAVVWRVW